MDEVYIVTEGVYSGYRIIAAFTDKGVAEQLADKLNGEAYSEEARVETYPVNPELEERVAALPGHRYRVRMLKHGDLVDVTRQQLTIPTWKNDYDVDDVLEYNRYAEYLPNGGTYHGQPDEPYFEFALLADDDDEAVKIAGDWRRRLLANPHLLRQANTENDTDNDALDTLLGDT